MGIALDAFPETSFQNIFEGVVAGISDPDDRSLVDVRLDIGVPLIATITSNARQALALAQGTRIYAMIKSISISLGTCVAPRQSGSSCQDD